MALAVTKGRFIGAIFFGIVGLTALGNIVSPQVQKDTSQSPAESAVSRDEYADHVSQGKVLSEKPGNDIPSNEASLRRVHRW